MTGPAREIEVRSHVEVPLGDGTVLAARIWLPVDAAERPVPVILEYLPYRLGDGTAAGDHEQMAAFAEHGYAGVRVDIRGSGESAGLLLDEYTVQEQEDGLEVIAWLAAQPWSTGAVGMIGYSWGGFNGLQLAARRPPALKAVLSGYASDDRYADDVHYRGGLVLAMDMLHWSTCMHGWQARPPDPEVVGDGWREAWLARLELPPWIGHWLAHQRRDGYWRNGSVRDDPAAIECAVLCVAGWTDGYSDAALRLVAALDAPARAIIGPWGHNDPAAGAPGPSIDLPAEALRFWDRWLKGDPNGWEDGPALWAYLQDPVAPSASLAERPGRWIAEAAWPSAAVTELVLPLGDGTLGAASLEPGERTVASVQTVGLTAGAWCADGRSADLPLDQRIDDALSLTWTSEPLDAPLEILGFPELRLSLAADRPLAFVSARLCEVAADGASLLVTRAQLNLCHRASHAESAPIVPGEELRVTLTLDGIAHRFAAGSRLRVSLSPCNWPLAWPSPEPVTLTVRHGAGEGTALVLPVRDPSAADGPAPAPPPAGFRRTASLGVERLSTGPAGVRSITRDLGSGRAGLRFVWDCGGLFRLPGGMLYEDTSEVTYSIVEGDPLSARVDVANTATSGRADWAVGITATATMTSTADAFLTTSTLEVVEDGVRIFARTWDLRFPRDHL